MITENSTSDALLADAEPARLPQGLNILTILTIIGSSLGILLSLATPMLMDFTKKNLMKARDSGQDLSPKQLTDIRNGLDMVALTEKNLVVIIAMGVICAALCLVGAIMMRKLKKDGFWLYVAGEILPFIGGLFIMGMAQYSSAFSFVVPVIALIFIALYASNRKYLVY